MTQAHRPGAGYRGSWFVLAVCTSLLGWAPASLAQEAARPVVLFDFEQQELGKTWGAQGPVRVARKPVPSPTAGAGLVPAGQGAEIQAAPRSVFFTREGQAPKDWRKYETLEFWVYRSPAEAQRAATSVIDVQVAEKGPHAIFSRRLDLTHQGWSKISLRLGWFRSTGGRVPRWDQIDRLQFHFRDQANIWLDSVALQQGKADRSSELSEDELRELAFPGAGKDAVRVKRTDEVVILTNVAELELDKLATHLAKVSAAVFRDLPFLEKPATPPYLIVFRSREEYQAFPPRFAQKLSAVSGPPQSGGYTIQGIATSFWDPVQGTLRPVYTHEFVHALVERTAFLPNKTEWFQEGLANRYQLQFHPQRNWRQIVLGGLQNENQRSPLRVLCTGQPISGDHYWQAVTVMDTLLSAAPYQKKFPDLVAAFQKSGSTDLGPQLAAVLQTDWDTFEKTWRNHCQKAHAGGR
jgi:hypothetical protein